jgi:hypothetical protein
MERKTPAAMNGRGLETLPGNFHALFSIVAYQAQTLAARFALPISTAAVVAAFAFGEGAHG